MPFCFHTFMPIKQNISFAGFRLSRAVFDLATNFCSWYIVDTVEIMYSSASFIASLVNLLRLFMSFCGAS